MCCQMTFEPPNSDLFFSHDASSEECIIGLLAGVVLLLRLLLLLLLGGYAARAAMWDVTELLTFGVFTFYAYYALATSSG